MIQLRDLAPYLPYKIKVKLEKFPIGDGIRTFELDCGHDFHFYLQNGYVKPLLKPMSSYEGSEAEEEIYCLTGYLGYVDENIDLEVRYDVMEILCKHHFDCFRFIETGNAIAI